MYRLKNEEGSFTLTRGPWLSSVLMCQKYRTGYQKTTVRQPVLKTCPKDCWILHLFTKSPLKQRIVRTHFRRSAISPRRELKSEETPEHEEEAENTRLFLALTPSGKSGHSKTADSSKLGYEDMMADQSESRQCGVSRGKKKQDFVKKNIELAKDAGSQVLMTDAEKARLAEILQDMNDGDEKDQRDSSLWALPVPAGQGYTPEPAELDQLQHIDSRLQLLLLVEDFLSLRSNYPDRSLLEQDVFWQGGFRVYYIHSPGGLWCHACCRVGKSPHCQTLNIITRPPVDSCQQQKWQDLSTCPLESDTRGGPRRGDVHQGSHLN
ncbi:hypothetical protein JZ751_002858 [Albula glossodonta]|uniref:Fibrous sheath-interacting protein 1 n=1 Tax=Albula glossodonta TaxID=121402 RepID=A0A8T2NCH9_9TELE|nr:hypothetical protein JZ751_002858 [Albula glossodonta]